MSTLAELIRDRSLLITIPLLITLAVLVGAFALSVIREDREREAKRARINRARRRLGMEDVE